MSDEEKRRKPWGCAVAVVLLPVLYILGPVGWLDVHATPAVQTALEAIYMPLELFVKFTGLEGSLEDVLLPYAEWWAG